MSRDADVAYLMSLSDAVTDKQGYRLDGEWVNPASVSTTNSLVSEFPSGDGHAGGSFNFALTLLAGDCNLNNWVNFADYQTLTDNYGLNLQSFWTLGDFDSDGVVGELDFNVLKNNYGMTDASWTDGDLNGDEAVTLADVDIFFM